MKSSVMANTPPNDINDLPRMVPDRDDIARRKRTAPPPPPIAPKKDSNNSGDDGSGGSSWLVYVLIVVLASGIGYLGYDGWQTRNGLQEAQRQLVTTNVRLVELERQLSATDESLSLNESAIQSKLNNILSEIRKLWDVADVRNRDWIRENQAAITELQTATGTLRSQMSSSQALTGELNTSVSRLIDQFDDELALRNELSDLLAELNTRQRNLASTVARLDEEDSSLRARVDVIGLRAEGAVEQATELNQLVNRLRTDTDALASQLNREAQTRSALADSVVQLRSRINALDAGDENSILSRLDTIDAARADTTQRLAALQAQISRIRSELDEFNRQVDDFTTP
ncbi:hypothetical protein NFC81_12690 [Salinispirillum sp. LH 10-3-1]|uniref:Uncharacterized protein n=1 Tax=Salinispirillum sp. LH 10-3-1 TaxID=2952525 RepID=A0AB38YDZ7_9GAMM